jgi:hypothetical protein
MAHPPFISSVVDRHLVDYGPDPVQDPVPDPTFHFDADPDSTPSLTKDGKSGEFFSFYFYSQQFQFFIFLVSV